MHWAYYHKRSPRKTWFRLSEARLCPSCDAIFDAEVCPVCGSESFIPVSKWISPLQPAAPLAGEEREPTTGSRGRSAAQPRDPVSVLFRYLSDHPRKEGPRKQ